jgi:hypothetical protein
MPLSQNFVLFVTFYILLGKPGGRLMRLVVDDRGAARRHALFRPVEALAGLHHRLRVIPGALLLSLLRTSASVNVHSVTLNRGHVMLVAWVGLCL